MSATPPQAGIAGVTPAAGGFARTFLLTSYALVGVAFAAVASSGEIGVVAPLAFTIAFVASLVWRRSPTPRPGVARIWTALLLMTFAALVAWSIEDDNWLLHALEFALVMTASRLFQRRYAKDWLQLYALSFLLILVAAVIHPTLTFAISFVVYAILAIWALVMLHIVHQIEVATHQTPEELEPSPAAATPRLDWSQRLRLRLRALRGLPPPAPPLPSRPPLPDGPIGAEALAWRSRRLIGPGFLAFTSALALAALAVSMLFFLLFPRIGMGFFFARTRNGQSVTGFADEVALGGFGRIKTSAEVVMRVSFPSQPERALESLRLRGLSFDTFDGTRWSRGQEPAWSLRRLGQRFEVQEPQLSRDQSTTSVARIYLEPLHTENSVLFAPPRTTTVEWLDSEYDTYRRRRKRVESAPSGDLRYLAPKDVALNYQVTFQEPRSESVRRRLMEAPLDATGDDLKIPRGVAKRYLQLPANLDPRIAALAKTLVRGETPAKRALALESALRRDWTYSLAGDQDNDAPLLDFLFGKRHGHCEYFATAMAVMLRTQGIPARVVNGFLGGEQNEFGGYRMIKQGDAHSWVEAYMPGAGWHSFEPTPAAGQLAPVDDGVAAALRRVADGAAMLWYSWIVEYDLERQFGVLRAIRAALPDLRSNLRLRNADDRGLRQVDDEGADLAGTKGPQLDLRWPGIIAALAAATALILLWRRRRGRHPDGVDRRLRQVEGALRDRLQALDLAPAPHQTFHQSRARAAAEGEVEVADALADFAAAWDRARWRDPADSAATALAVASGQRAIAACKAAATQRRRRRGASATPAPLGVDPPTDAARGS